VYNVLVNDGPLGHGDEQILQLHVLVVIIFDQMCIGCTFKHAICPRVFVLEYPYVAQLVPAFNPVNSVDFDHSVLIPEVQEFRVHHITPISYNLS
jgi:hypothetical protein